MFLLPKPPSLALGKAYEIKYPFTALFKNTLARTACVGFMDLEIPAAPPRPLSHISRCGRHILQLETVLIALCYPSAIGSGNGEDPGGALARVKRSLASSAQVRNVRRIRWSTTMIDGEQTAQIEMRLTEVEEAYDVVKAISAGKGSAVAGKNLRNADDIGASSCGLDDVDWDSWRGKVNTAQVTMVGHSFGAATTIEILRHADGFQWVGQGII